MVMSTGRSESRRMVFRVVDKTTNRFQTFSGIDVFSDQDKINFSTLEDAQELIDLYFSDNPGNYRIDKWQVTETLIVKDAAARGLGQLLVLKQDECVFPVDKLDLRQLLTPRYVYVHLYDKLYLRVLNFGEPVRERPHGRLIYTPKPETPGPAISSGGEFWFVGDIKTYFTNPDISFYDARFRDLLRNNVWYLLAVALSYANLPERLSLEMDWVQLDHDRCLPLDESQMKYLNDYFS